MRWDLYCRVIDNHGDAGVCWRLAADLAARGEEVRLVIDDAEPLAWMAPHGAAGVQVMRWDEADEALVPLADADVVVEAFGCTLPDRILAAMAARTRPPVWINLEYLSAEDYVERSHALPSPQQFGPAAGLTKWFFYPGFTPATGGLLREPELIETRARFDAAAWLAARGLQPQPGERVVSLFCYENAALPSLLDQLGRTPTLLLATAGHAARQVQAALGASMQHGALRAVALPLLDQADFDRLLWSCDLNFVRGEDSWVRAQWAGRPFVWQAYPQSDGAHRAKVDAFLARFLAGGSAALATPLAAFWNAWNEAGPPLPELPLPPTWQAQATAWRDGLVAQPDLVTRLIGFIARRQ